jgi:hypothetical protein
MDTAGNVLATASNPAAWGDNVSATFTQSFAGERIVIAVTGATHDVFAVGGYQLQVRFPNAAQASTPTPTPGPTPTPTPTPQPTPTPTPVMPAPKPTPTPWQTNGGTFWFPGWMRGRQSWRGLGGGNFFHRPRSFPTWWR